MSGENEVDARGCKYASRGGPAMHAARNDSVSHLDQGMVAHQDFQRLRIGAELRRGCPDRGEIDRAFRPVEPWLRAAGGVQAANGEPREVDRCFERRPQIAFVTGERSEQPEGEVPIRHIMIAWSDDPRLWQAVKPCPRGFEFMRASSGCEIAGDDREIRGETCYRGHRRLDGVAILATEMGIAQVGEPNSQRDFASLFWVG